MNKLVAKIFITGDIVALTGLHIGGSKSALDIGGVDLNVIKKPDGTPFIPGSSLKGKLRALLARCEGSVAITRREAKGQKSDADVDYLREIFGTPGDEGDSGTGFNVTRLIVRDADLIVDEFKKQFGDELELGYSEIKWENTINRTTGTAEHPRQLERVPAGARFRFEMVYDEYSDEKTEEHLARIRTAMRLLEGDYLGGQGSRGYGKVRFENVKFSRKTVKAYESEKDELPVEMAFTF
jgi:CRISPR-associated protein Csm3